MYPRLAELGSFTLYAYGVLLAAAYLAGLQPAACEEAADTPDHVPQGDPRREGYGIPTERPWAITFTDPFAAANVGTPLDVPLHPTQLYEAGAELVILVVLLATERRGRPFPGRTFWLYVLLYAISRFIVEFYRGDPRGTAFGVVSTSQLISVILVALSVAMIARLREVVG
jgi:prolipoprotein diacylglyceryltransferase